MSSYGDYHTKGPTDPSEIISDTDSLVSRPGSPRTPEQKEINSIANQAIIKKIGVVDDNRLLPPTPGKVSKRPPPSAPKANPTAKPREKLEPGSEVRWKGSSQPLPPAPRRIRPNEMGD
jgi:hypothetical protein